MQKLLFIIAIFLSLTCAAQHRLEGAWGIKFGASQELVKSEIKKRLGLSPLPKSDTSTLIYEDCKFGEFRARNIVLQFSGNRFYGAILYVVPVNENEILDLYESIKTSISTKYFPPNSKIESYARLYERGSTLEIYGIKTRKSRVSSIWGYPIASSQDSLLNGQIVLTVTPELYIVLGYYDNDLSKKVKEAEEAENQKDY